MANEKKMDCVILGLLSDESLTGYEIKKRMDTALRFFWSASFGSIYPTLNSMVNNGFVTKLDEPDSSRGKVIYTITDTGKEYLKTWLALPAVKDELRYETLLKIFFGGETGAGITLEHIRDFEAKIESELPYLKGTVRKLAAIQSDEEDHKYFLVTAMFGEMVYETYLKWCKDAAEILGDK